MFSPSYKFIEKKRLTQYELFGHIAKGWRPSRPELVPDHYWDLIQKCWHQNPNERPTFAEITEILKNDIYAINEFGMKTDLNQLHEYQNRIDKY